MSLLEVDDLAVSFARAGRRVRVLDGVSFSIEPSEILGVVGESGCVHSTWSRSSQSILGAHDAAG